MLMTQKAPFSYLGRMLELWLQWAPGDRRGSKNFATFKNLRKALLQVDTLAAKAHDLEQAIGTKINIMINNYTTISLK